MNTIAFPKLGLNMKINPVAFHIGGKEIYWYALIILTGFILGALFVLKTCRKRGVNPDNVYDIAMFGLIAGIIGARLYYVLFSLDEFDSFWDVFKIWNGGLAIYGGIIGAFISTAIYCKIKNLNVLNVFDVCCPGLLIGQLIGRWGNFVNAEVFGRETSLPFIRCFYMNHSGICSDLSLSYASETKKQLTDRLYASIFCGTQWEDYSWRE